MNIFNPQHVMHTAHPPQASFTTNTTTRQILLLSILRCSISSICLTGKSLNHRDYYYYYYSINSDTLYSVYPPLIPADQSRTDPNRRLFRAIFTCIALDSINFQRPNHLLYSLWPPALTHRFNRINRSPVGVTYARPEPGQAAAGI